MSRHFLLPAVLFSVVLYSVLQLSSLGATASEVLSKAGESSYQEGCDEAPSVVSVPASRRAGHVVYQPPWTRLQGQPYAYGYFGARPAATSANHTSYRADWYQWRFQRGD